MIVVNVSIGVDDSISSFLDFFLDEFSLLASTLL